ncbi:MAG: 4-hydroxy-tetrahydrodipicolinate reductase [Acidobacteria bacterium]|nr:4-hydroxy-tetrahydrodipicolinate reductase [Acidobacteriota bacterium]
MKIAIVGYGKMGKIVERIALERGHSVVARFDIDNNIGGKGLTAESLVDADVAIEFSMPDVTMDNIRPLVGLRVPTVVGTTGWYTELDEVRQLVETNQAALVWGANFSIGVNLFFKLVRDASALFERYNQYDPYLIESHHKFKKDAPSGTALVMARMMREAYGDRTPAAVSVRAGHIPGTHEVGFDSEADTITLTHTARNREGFAAGAVLAAELIVGKQGIYEFPELLFETIEVEQ